MNNSFTTLINNPYKVLKLHPERPNQVPMTYKENWFTVPGVVSSSGGAKSLELMIDTGAGGTDILLPKHLFDTLKLKSGMTTTAHGTYGSSEDTEFFILPSLYLNGKMYRNLIASTCNDPKKHGWPFDGILGMNFLKKHKAIVDCDKGMLKLDTTA